MEPEKKDEPIIEDDKALDAELSKSLNDLKAGNAPTPIAEVPPEKKDEGATGQTGASDPGKKEGGDAGTPPAVEKKEEGYEFRIPNKGKFESDESYELRIGLLDLVKRRKAATTPEAKQQLSDEITKTKGQLRTLNTPDRINNLNNEVPKTEIRKDDPALAADLERLKELGGATKEDIQEVIRQERFVSDQKSTLENFVSRHSELKDADVREVFFGFVDSNYNWADKSGTELMTVLELARENMFKPSESIQERVLKGADVQQKVNAMQFPGGTGNEKGFSPEMRKSIDELKAVGYSEEKALELLSD